MASQISIDDDVLEALKQRAIPFQDHEPNDVLRRILLGGGQPQLTETPAPIRASEVAPRERTSKDLKRSMPARRKRAPSSALMPETEYRYPILRVIFDNGGRMPTREAVAAVGALVEDKLLPADLEMLGKKPRWEGRVQFTRLRLIKDGLMRTDSPRGVWEITDAGEKVVKNQLSTSPGASGRTERSRAGAL